MKIRRFKGIVAPEGVRTGDGRMFEAGALRWETPCPFRYVDEDNGAHDGAQVVGVMETLSRVDGNIEVDGFFYLDTEAGAEAAQLAADGILTGVSVDLDDVSFEYRFTAPDDVEVAPAEPEPGEEIIVVVDGASDLMVVTDARIRAATLVSIPAFSEAKIEVYGEVIDTALTDEDEPTLEEVLASAGPLAPPAGWFADPVLNGPTPLTITEDGRVYGHLATWDTCHTANPAGEGVCITPPHSAKAYARFHTGTLKTDSGEIIGVGKITMGTGHAATRLNPAATLAHYDNTGTAVADVRAGEDAYGIWVAGAMRPGVSDEQVRALRASPLSGDWRRVDGNLELHAALAVNVPGFPIPTPAGLVAAGTLDSLVASGVLAPDASAVETLADTFSASDLAVLRAFIERERTDAKASVLKRVEAANNRAKVAAMAASLARSGA